MIHQLFHGSQAIHYFKNYWLHPTMKENAMHSQIHEQHKLYKT